MNTTILILTLLLSALSHYTIQRVFIRFKKFDDFNHRSSHKTLATRTGGISVFFTLLVISFYNYFQGIEIFDYSLFIPLGIMFIVGVYDDFYKADFKLKFFLQIIVAKILIDQGYVISNYYGLFGLYEIPWVLAQLSTVFVFLVVVNAFNFVDGIDGLAITEVIKAILFVELFSDSITKLNSLGSLVIFSLFTLYYFNFKSKKKIFLGDGGSLFLGSLIMIYILHVLGAEYDFKPKYLVNKTLFVILVVLYPLVDLLRVFLVRIRSGKSPFIADSNHIHHRLNTRLKGQHFPTLICLQVISIALFFILFTIAR